LPDGVPATTFGSRLTSLVALFTGRYCFSKRLVQNVVWDMMGVRIGLGSISNLERRVSDALAAPVEEARGYVRDAPWVHQDETGWRETMKLKWLWVTVSPSVTLFHVTSKRSREVSEGILGADYRGVVISDRHHAVAERGG
jgi:hypothetical protein